MKKVQISLTAKNYADALVKIGQDKAMPYEEILENLIFIKNTCESSNELTTVLENPAVSNEAKYSIIDDIFENRINIKIIEFLKILIEKKRFKEFEGIISAFSDELDKINNIQRVEVVSAISLDEGTKKRITEKLQNKLKKNIIAEWQVNEDIISGLIVKINDDVIDSSLKNKLESLCKNII